MAPLEPGTNPAPDQALVEGLQRGDADVLRQIMNAHWSPLVGFAQRILGAPPQAEDVVQEAFVRLWTRRETLKAEGSLRSLLYTMVRNASLDELRKADRRSRAHEEGSPPSPPRTPYEDVQGAELQRMAASAVAKLPAKRQEVFRLVREEGLSYQEVAQVMELSVQTVANHMSLALADLRTVLKPFVTSDRPRGEGERKALSNGDPAEEV